MLINLAGGFSFAELYKMQTYSGPLEKHQYVKDEVIMETTILGTTIRAET